MSGCEVVGTAYNVVVVDAIVGGERSYEEVLVIRYEGQVQLDQVLCFVLKGKKEY